MKFFKTNLLIKIFKTILEPGVLVICLTIISVNGLTLIILQAIVMRITQPQLLAIMLDF